MKSPISYLLVVPLILAFAIFTSTLSAQTIPSEVSKAIPQGASQIVMEQNGTPPADVYVDTYYLMERANYKITASEETLEPQSLYDLLNGDSPLVFSAKKQVNDNLALWFTFNVEEIPGGGKLLASVKYSDDVNTPTEDWKQAKWTNGKAKTAFTKALDLIRHDRYDTMDFTLKVIEPTPKDSA